VRRWESEARSAAVLYRTNSQSRLFEEAMRRYGLKYHVVAGFRFTSGRTIKDLISYLQGCLNPMIQFRCCGLIQYASARIGQRHHRND